MPREEVETKIEEMKEATFKSLEKLQQEKESIVSQMAELKKVLYAKFKDSINLEEDWFHYIPTKLLHICFRWQTPLIFITIIFFFETL